MISLIIWTSLSITAGFAFWAATIRSIRLLGDENEQGILYGWFQGFVGFTSALLGFIGVWMFSNGATEAVGLRNVVLLFGSMNLVFSLVVLFFFENPEVSADDHIKIEWKHIVRLIKEPKLYLVSFVIFAAYAMFSGQSYFTPYMTEILGVGAALAGGIAIFRTYIIRLVISPIGGRLADRIGSSAKVLIFAFIITIILLLMIIFNPFINSTYYTIGLIFMVAVIVYVSYAIMWATIEESNIPRNLMGTAVGLVSIIGFIPDAFMHLMFGNWLDKYGVLGYNYIFGFLVIVSVIGLISSGLILKFKN